MISTRSNHFAKKKGKKKKKVAKQKREERFRLI